MGRTCISVSGFNTSKVRLEAADCAASRALFACFNTSKVRLEDGDTFGAEAYGLVSIPQRCDWKAFGSNDATFKLMFQYLKGAIGSYEEVWHLERDPIVFQYLKGAIGSYAHQRYSPD